MSKPGCFPDEVPKTKKYLAPPDKLPTGDWWMIANGRISQFKVTSDDPLTITWQGNAIEDELFSVIDNTTGSPSHRLSFIRKVKSKEGVRQEFVGYLMWDWNAEPFEDKYRLAGHFYQKSGPGAAPGEAGGWYATIHRDNVGTVE